MSDTPKIIQLLMSRNDNVWQGVLLGLGDDGITYHCQGDTWQPCIPKLALEDKAIELAEVTKQRDELLEALDKLLDRSYQFTDEGPLLEGWKSDEFRAEIEKAESAIAKTKGGAQ